MEPSGHGTRETRVLAEGLECSFFLSDADGSPFSDLNPGMTFRGYASGPMTCTTRIKPPCQTRVFGICFRPGGAYPFFSVPAGELMNVLMGIEDVWQSSHLDLIKLIQDPSHTLRHRMVILNRHFLQRLEDHPEQDNRIRVLVNLMERYKGDVKIDSLAQLAGLGRRQLERLFRERVGLSPKQLCRSLRFKHFLRFASLSPSCSWAETALDFGYCDQSHMIRDFRHYTGESPAAFFGKPDAMDRFFMGNV